MSTSPRHSVSVSGVIVGEEQHILAVQRRATGAWTLPGGVLELDESPIDGVIREVLEETGVTIEPDVLTGVYKNMSTGVVSLVFRCRPTNGATPRPSDETSQARWITSDEADALMTEPFAMRVRDALAAGPPAVRVIAVENIMAAKID